MRQHNVNPHKPNNEQQMTLKIATWNASGLSGKVDELLDLMHESNIDITLVNETWLKEYESCHPAVRFSQPTTRKPNQPHNFYGLAIVLSDRIARNSRLDNLVRLNGSSPPHEQYGVLAADYLIAGISITHVYLPPNLENIDCITIIREAVAKQQQIILGDWNMRLGKLTNDSIRTARGNALHKLLTQAGYKLLTPSESDKFSFRCQKGRSNVDLIYAFNTAPICSDRSDIHDTTDLGSEHFPVSVKLKINHTQTTSKATPERRFDTRKLVSDPELQGKFSHAFQVNANKILYKYSLLLKQRDPQALDHPAIRQELIDDIDNRLCQTIIQTCRQYLPERRRTKPHPNQWWKTSEIQAAICQRRSRYNYARQLETSCSPKHIQSEAWQQYREARQQLKRLIKKHKSHVFYTFAEELSSKPTTESIKVVHNILKKRRPASGLSNEADALEEYAKYFASTFSPNEQQATLSKKQVLVRPFTQTNSYRQTTLTEASETFVKIPEVHSTVLKVIKRSTNDRAFPSDMFSERTIAFIIDSLPNNKAPGVSGITAEMIKGAKSVIAILLSRLFPIFFRSRKCPASWQTARIIPIFKKGLGLG